MSIRLNNIEGCKSVYKKDFIKELEGKYADRYFDIEDINIDCNSKVVTAKNIKEMLEDNIVSVGKLKNSYYIEIRFPFSTDFTLYKATIKSKDYKPFVEIVEEEEELNNKEFIKELSVLNKEIECKLDSCKFKINNAALIKLINNNVEFAIKSSKDYYVKLNNDTTLIVDKMY